MSHNLKSRDTETGWCYKNGGKAPYGYKTVHLTRGQDQKGKPIIKTIWELDSETYPIVHKIIVDMFTKQQLSYRQIRDELNSKGIASPRGEYWAISTILEMLKENRLEQYTGTAIWNREDKQTNGRKYKPRNEWVIVENALPAIITQDQLEAALERKKLNKYNAPDGATRNSSYLLTGKNFEGNPMFTCGHCGGNIIGYGNSSHNWKKYICG
ncbi:MAG: recombinase family protein, partial [Bacillota bacterium]|nr:recombinase family protein [Bacillota bacterium]